MAYALNLYETKDKVWNFEGYNQTLGGWVIPRPINAHVHLRSPYEESEMFKMVVPETAKLYHWATAMPNLKKFRIRTVAGAIDYRNRILERGRLFNSTFDVTVPFYVEADLDLKEIEEGFKCSAWISGKLYPKNGTTNSDEGVDFLKIRKLWPLFALMERLGIILLVHAEVVRNKQGNLVADRKREGLAIAVIDEILRNFPKLKLVFEHISTKRAVEAVKRWQRTEYIVEATIAPQYLLWNSTILFVGGMNPINFSIPILKDEEDRLAILQFMLEGGGMLGTDSAPHDVRKKSQHTGCPGGLFNEPVGLYIYFHLFRVFGGKGWFERFKEFACYKAPRFYGLPAANDNVIIREKDQTIKDVYGNGGTKVISLFAGMQIPYSVESLAA